MRGHPSAVYRKILTAEPVTDRDGNRAFTVTDERRVLDFGFGPISLDDAVFCADDPIVIEQRPPDVARRWFRVMIAVGLVLAGFAAGVLVSAAHSAPAVIPAKHLRVPLPRPRPICLNAESTISIAEDLARMLETRRGILPTDDELKWLLGTAANLIRVDARFLAISNLACPQP